MKMLLCENCGDLVVPSVTAHEAKWCRCNASCCWWINPKNGEFGCWSQLGKRAVSIVGINNMLFTEPFSKAGSDELGCIQQESIDRMINETPDSFLFKRLKSMIIRFRPGFTSDTIFATVPPPETDVKEIS